MNGNSKIKHAENGSIERYKAGLLTQGFSQRPGWDYLEFFAPTIRLAVVRAIFALVVAENLKYKSIDIITAYLKSTI